MEHLWTKIKAYLDNRFGTGTYYNTGSFNSDSKIIAANESFIVGNAISDFRLIDFAASNVIDKFVLNGIYSEISFYLNTFGIASVDIQKEHGLMYIGKTRYNSLTIQNQCDTEIKLNYIASGKIGKVLISASSSGLTQLDSAYEAILLFW